MRDFENNVRSFKSGAKTWALGLAAGAALLIPTNLWALAHLAPRPMASRPVPIMHPPAQRPSPAAHPLHPQQRHGYRTSTARSSTDSSATSAVEPSCSRTRHEIGESRCRLAGLRRCIEFVAEIATGAAKSQLFGRRMRKVNHIGRRSPDAEPVDLTL